MSTSAVNTILWVFALLLLLVGVAQLVLSDNVVGGAASIAIGASVVAVAASTKKKSDG